MKAQSSRLTDADSFKDDMLSPKDPTLFFHDKPSLQSFPSKEAVVTGLSEANDPLHNEVLVNGKVNLIDSNRENSIKIKPETERSSVLNEPLFSFGSGIQNINSQKVILDLLFMYIL